MTSILSCRNVSRHFGAVRAVDGVDLTVETGDRHALIGPNGAGKSTLLHLVCGVLRASDGTVLLGEDDITKTSQIRRNRLGLSQTFQNSSLFVTMTARQNVALSVQRRYGVYPWPRRSLRRRVEARAQELLDTVGLTDRGDVLAGALAHGERRQLEMAVALACEPRLLLLDEPAAGMSPAESYELADLIEKVSTDVTVLFVEHDLELVFRLATRVTVLHLGSELLTGSPDEVRASSAVQEAYLGAGVGHENLFLPGDPPGDEANPAAKGGQDVPTRT